MTTQEILGMVIAVNDARLDGRLTREAHAIEFARIDRILREHGLTWSDLQNP